MKYGFIGVGRMGSTILEGLLKASAISKSDILILGRDYEKTSAKASEYGVEAVKYHADLVDRSDIVIIGVEPKTFPEIMPLIAETYAPSKLIVSMAAGVKIADIEEPLGDGAKIIRIMPNAPARVGRLMASVSRNKNVSDADIERVIKLLSTMGKAEEVPESQIDAVIGLSGSSPAYTYMYIRALTECGMQYGMPPEKARVFAAQAVLGAAKIVLDEETPLDELIDNICTPGGTTVEAVQVLQDAGFEDTIQEAASAAIEKSISMSK